MCVCVSVCECVSPGVEHAAEQDDGSHGGDDLLVALVPGVEGKHAHCGVQPGNL